MTCPRCKCPECAKAELNAVLARRIVACETIPEMTDAEMVKAFKLLAQSRPLAHLQFDPAAEQLAMQVGELAGELERTR